MSQMCPNCSFDNPDDAQTCSNCPTTLRGLLGSKTILSERYEVVSVLGCGAMGAVYLAQDRRLVGRRCAIKENRPDPNASVEIQAQTREQFLAEARVLARLDHFSLPKVSDYFIENDREYLVMDYVEGEDLESRLERAQQPLPEAEVLAWTDQVLDALIYLHNQRPQPIIHRDIKPANLRIDLHGRIKLVDFGLVKLLDADNPATKAEMRGVGTPAYAPLEQFASSNDHTDARSDIYALGSTVYHMLTNLSPPDVHQRLLNPQILLPLRELNPHLSEKTERVILRAMEIYPDQRYQSAEEMRHALSETEAPAAARQPAGAPRRASSPTSLWLFGILGLVFVLLLLGGAVYLLFNNQGSSPPAQQPVAGGVEQPTSEPGQSTPTEVLVQTLGDAPAPTETPTLVLQPTTPPSETSGSGDTLQQETDTPTPAPTDTPTAAPQVVAQPGGISAATLQGTIAYPVFNGTDYDLYLGQADGSGTQLFQNSASQPAFSPDGTRIAFRSWALDSRGIIVMDATGANPLVLTNFVEDQLPTWSSDGSKIVLLSRRSGDRKSQLIQVSSFESLGESTVLTEGEYPSIGPNNVLAFKGWGITGTGLRVSTLAFDTIQPLTDINEDTAPVPSPNGETIAFMSRRGGNWEIYSVNADGSNLQRLTDDPAQDGLPTWSPDGQALAFVSDRGGSWAIWAITPIGQDQQKLFDIQGSPDGFVGTDQFASRGWAEERISWKQ